MTLEKFYSRMASAVSQQPGLIGHRSTNMTGGVDACAAFACYEDETLRKGVELLRNGGFLSTDDRAKAAASIAERSMELVMDEVGITGYIAIVKLNDARIENMIDRRDRVGAAFRAGKVPGLSD